MRLEGLEPPAGCLAGTTAPALCRPAKTQLASERKRYRQSFAERSSAVDRSGDRSGLRALPSAGRDTGLPGLAGRRLERKLIARDDGHPMARDGPEAKAVRVGQCYRMERVLRCLDLGTIASEDLCSEGAHSSGRLSEAS